MGVDLSLINTETTIGQLALLIGVIISGIVALRPSFKDLRDRGEKRSYKVIANELVSVKKELGFSLQVQRHATEWQLVAREYIRLLRLELADAGVETNDRLKDLHQRLEGLDSKDIYSEHILIKEDE